MRILILFKCIVAMAIPARVKPNIKVIKPITSRPGSIAKNVVNRKKKMARIIPNKTLTNFVMVNVRAIGLRGLAGMSNPLCMWH